MSLIKELANILIFTDGASVSTYVYDEFDRNIDSFIGKLKNKEAKHRYKVEGNIIQLFAFTGYQEEEVSGLKFAQARFYSADNGRFIGEDKVKGKIDTPISLNHYLYCRSNSICNVDYDGEDASGNNCYNSEMNALPFYYGSTMPIRHLTIPELYKIGLNKAEQRYQEECARQAAGKSLSELQKELDNNPNIPDYTEMIDSWVAEKEEYFDKINKNALTKPRLYYEFYMQVKTEGEMDIKQNVSWKTAFGFDVPEGYFLYHGQVMDAATAGNVIYSYVGAKYFSEFELYSGGAAVQVKRYHWQDLFYMYSLPYWGDMEEDHEAIELGIKWRKEGFPCDE